MVDPKTIATVASQTGGLVGLLIAAINGILQQKQKDDSLRRAHENFLRRLNRVASTLEAIREAPPVVDDHLWGIVTDLDKVVQEAQKDLMPKPAGLYDEGKGAILYRS